MESSEGDNNSASSSSQVISSNQSSPKKEEISDASELLLNSKDELNWVENEIVVEDSMNDKILAEVVVANDIVNRSDTKVLADTNDNSLTEVVYTGNNAKESSGKVLTEVSSVDIKETDNLSPLELATVETVSNKSKSLNLCKDIIDSNDENESKLWDYFTEHNSSQLRCNLCSGLFLYQSNASHLLKHIEFAHNIPIQSSNNSVETISHPSSSMMQNDVSYCSDNIEPDETYNFENSEPKDYGNSSADSSNPRTADSKENSKIAEYFTLLDSGKIRCNLCCRVMSQKSSKVRHLYFNHSDVYHCIIDSASSDGEEVELSDYDLLDQTDTSEISKLWNYFKKLETPHEVQCNLCCALLKFTEGVNIDLVRHLKMKHKDVFMNKKRKHVKRAKTNRKGNSKVLNAGAKSGSSMIVLEIIQDGNNCLITNAKLQTGTEHSNSNGSEVSFIEGREASVEPDSAVESTSNLAKTGVTSKESVDFQDYFVLSDLNDSAQCVICSDVIDTRDSIILLNHLNTKHQSIFTNPFYYSSFKASPMAGLNNDENVTYELNKELTVDDISKINLSSIGHSNKSYCLQNSIKKLKCKGNTANSMWKYFTKLYRDKVMCNVCDKTFSSKLGQTSNMAKHLKAKHRYICSRIVKRPMKVNSNTSSANLHQMSKRLKKSDVVWKFFTKLDDTKAQCDLCEHINVLYYSSRSRSNLVKHLKSKHKYFLDLTVDEGFNVVKDETSVNQIDLEDVCETNNCSNQDSVSGINMRVLFDYFTSDTNFNTCLKLEKDQIVCKLCTGTFLCDDLLNFEYTIKYHMQTCHASSLALENSLFLQDHSTIVLSLDSQLGNEATNPLEITSDSNYNELEAISNEINSYGK